MYLVRPPPGGGRHMKSHKKGMVNVNKYQKIPTGGGRVVLPPSTLHKAGCWYDRKPGDQKERRGTGVQYCGHYGSSASEKRNGWRICSVQIGSLKWRVVLYIRFLRQYNSTWVDNWSRSIPLLRYACIRCNNSDGSVISGCTWSRGRRCYCYPMTPKGVAV